MQQILQILYSNKTLFKINLFLESTKEDLVKLKAALDYLINKTHKEHNQDFPPNFTPKLIHQIYSAKKKLNKSKKKKMVYFHDQDSHI